MRTPSGILHIVDFKTDQIVSAIQPQDYWDDKRHWEIKNNIDMLDFTTFDGTKHAITLQQQNLVLKEVRDGRVIPYVITEAEKDSDKRSITTYASGAWVQIAKSGIINPQRIESKTVNEFIDMALLGMKWKRGNTEYAGFHTMTIDEFIDPLTFLKKIASIFDLEIQYRVEVVGSQITGWYVDMVKKRGQETGKEIELGKDLVGVKRIEHSREICTALVGFVRGEEEKVITVESINNGLPYITDSDAFQRWNEHGKHKFGFYTPETDEQNMTPQRLMTLMKTEFKKRVNTSVSYEVEAQSIGRVFGLSHELINEGDTVKIKDTGFTPELYLEARVIAGDESFTDPKQDKYVFGDYREIVDPNEELRKIYNRILSSLGNKQEMLDQLDKLVKDATEMANNAKNESEAAKTLAEKVQENIKNNTVEIIESKNPPTSGLKPYKTLWRDISNGKPGILKIWTGTAWESVVPDVEKVKKETLEQVNTQIESTKKELNTKVADVQKEAQAIAGQISDVKKEVQGKVDSNFVKEQIKDKADKSGVFTKDEINNGFVGKQIYETDKQGNVKKFQDINTSITQTNESIGQKAEKSELKTLSNDVVEVTKTVNETKQMAEGTKESLSQVTSKVDNAKVAERNLITNSNFGTGDATGWIIWDTLSGTGMVEQAVDLPEFSYCGRLTRTNSTADFWFLKDIKVTPGQYIISAFFKSSSLTMAIGIRDGSTAPTYKIVSLPKDLSDGKWHHVKLEVEFKTNEARIYFGTQKNKENTGEMFIAGTKLAEGTVFSTWSPAPEDQLTSNEFTKKTVEIEKNINGVTTSVSNMKNEQGKLTERMTKFEQTADGFKQSIESLTKKDNDISDKLSTLEQTVEGTKKTISDVQKTTTELKKTTTEITEQAGKISEKLESVEKKVTNDKAGGRNLLLDSNVKYEKTDYLINQYTLSENFSAGEEYTFVIKGSVPQGQKLGIWQNGGSNNVGYATSAYVSGITYVTFKAVATTVGNEKKLSLYSAPQNTTKSIVEWVALYKGNKPQDWTPAPENQVTIDEFTKKTNEITKSVDGTKEIITKVENNQSGFDKRVATVEKDATTIKQNVSLLQDTQTTQGRQLQEAKAGWENTAKALEGKVEIKQVEDYVAGFKIPDLKNTVNKNKEDLLAELANKLATEQYNQKMTLIDNRFTINERGINASAKTTDVYTKEQANGQFATSGYVRDMESRLQLTEKGVSISVKENDVIAAFNMSKENITLNANRINLRGFVTADHIKGQVLEGVTLKTSGNRFVEINKQDMKIFDLDKPRGYMGFMEAEDGSIQPALVLGSDNRKFSGTGSFYIYQKTPRINGTEQPSKAWATFGLSKGENASGSNIWSSYIQMQNDGGHLYAYADGRLYFDNLNDIVFNSVGWAPGYGKFMVTTTEPHYFKNNYGEFHFDRKSTGNSIYFMNGTNDHDLVLGRVMIRSSLVSGYDTGLQIKDTLGNGWRDIQLRTLRAEENISAVGQMWAKAFNPTSARNMKENIKDIPFSALEKVMDIAIKQYNFKDDMYGLYQMRVNKSEEQTEPYTTKEIETYFGMIADDTDEIFTDKEKRAINLYNTLSILIAAFQQFYHEFKEMKEENKQLKERVGTLENEVSALKELVQKLISEKPEQP